jgi:hypothetical protein
MDLKYISLKIRFVFQGYKQMPVIRSIYSEEVETRQRHSTYKTYTTSNDKSINIGGSAMNKELKMLSKKMSPKNSFLAQWLKAELYKM